MKDLKKEWPTASQQELKDSKRKPCCTLPIVKDRKSFTKTRACTIQQRQYRENSHLHQRYFITESRMRSLSYYYLHREEILENRRQRRIWKKIRPGYRLELVDSHGMGMAKKEHTVFNDE